MNNISRAFFSFLCLFTTLFANAQYGGDTAFVLRHNGHKIFKVANPDYTLSPYTGMTRQHWKDAALYLLQGAFHYVHNMKDPMQFPKQPGKSYPRSNAQAPTEKLEGLCRTLFMAAPLLREDSTLVINNIKVADYYRYHISKLVDSTDATFIQHRAPNGGPHQNLVEFGALSLSLFSIPEILWKPLPQQIKDALAATMLSYGDGPTVPSNWKFFNIFVLSFFKSQGYAVNEKLLVEYLDKSLAHYRGDGWYNDNPAYDYYSMWAFQMYGTVWSEFFGNTYYPEYAAKFKENFKPLKDVYARMFSKDGNMILWGRSMSYRMGAIIPFPLMGFENDANINYGWMRRISSGVLLQFLQNPDFIKDEVPTLGFYGAFEPAVQPYSCRGSAFWMGKAFLGLLVPAGNPFWNAKENDGLWDTAFKKDSVYNLFCDSSHILITDYPNIGASEIRAWCKVKAIDAGEPFRASENYNRLSYNSAFPWQADSVQGVVAMNYIFKNKNNEWKPLRLYDFIKFDNGIYYRNAVLETDTAVQLKLADIPLPNGILRVDNCISANTIDMRLGHYALPEVKGRIKTAHKKLNGFDIEIIDNGVYQMAMVSLLGWNKPEVKHTVDVNAVSAESDVINVSSTIHPSGKKHIYATLMLWKKSGEKFNDEELLPVKAIHEIREDAVEIIFRNGLQKQVVY
ncbi:DUF2264 domain-containing protein [Parafilimonas sp.]|uniref:DUF2264 domain-containing protein n=1 Tax=Parafilimonas sp. TaxID=1969739 RepID=UPI0039E277B3